MSLSILYVEDNDDLREALEMLLEADGREIVACTSAEEALPLLAERRFDVLVLDLTLPGISGDELARRVLAEHPAQPVILCSGFVFGSESARLGPKVRSLTKPFEVEALERLITQLVAA